jgi:hypothetical protein
MDLSGRGEHAWVPPAGGSRAMWRHNSTTSNRDGTDELDRLENAVEGCHDAARYLETIRVKSAGAGLAPPR